MTTTTHACPAPDCPIRVQPTGLACVRHWYALPADLRAEIRRHYHRGQTALTASPAYLDAFMRAVRHLQDQP